jgi:hypothetical protein
MANTYSASSNPVPPSGYKPNKRSKKSMTSPPCGATARGCRSTPTPTARVTGLDSTMRAGTMGRASFGRTSQNAACSLGCCHHRFQDPS